MELGDDHIKDLFSSKLSHFEPEIPSSIWDKIEAKLPEATLMTVVPKPALQNKTVKLGLWVSGVAAMIVAILFLLPTNEDSDTLYMFTQASSLDVASLRKEESNRNVVHNSTVPLLGNNYNKSGKQQKAVIASMLTEDNSTFSNKLDDENTKQPLESNFSTKIIALKEPLNFSTKKPNKISKTNHILTQADIESKIAEFEAEGDRQKGLLAYADKTQMQGESSLQLGVNGGSSVTTASQFKDDFNSIYSSNSTLTTRSTEAKMKHNQPVTFGLSISKQITKDLSIESGINYTYLSSRLGAEISDKSSQNEMQYLHYLGIPLTLNYTFARWNKFSFHSSLGIMIQKDFYGRETRRAFLEVLDSEFYSKHKISQKNPQFSTHGGLGASYPIYNKLRIYTTVGAAYYFDANNLYHTIYSDKKWLFNLNIGLRFEF